MASAGRILIIPKGDYNSSATYKMLDLVKYNGTAWLAKKTLVGIEPSDSNSEYWHNMFDIESVIDNKITSNWTNLTLNDGFQSWSENSMPRCKKIGDIVYIQGTITPKNDIESNSLPLLATLPNECVPKDADKFFVCGASATNIWILHISTTGNMMIARYGAIEDSTIPAGAMLSLDVSFSV